MSSVVMGARVYLRKLITPSSLLLEKIQNEPYELAVSKAVEKAYASGARKHGMTATIFQRRMQDVRKKLLRENKLVFINESTIISKTKGIQFTGLMEKYIKFVNLALASGASHLITYASQHFNIASILNKQFKIKILEPDDFL